MASYNYDAYAAQQEAQRSNNPNGGPEVQFLSGYLKEDGDVAVVRFPYHSMSDLVFETTHSVTFPGKRYPSRVRCTGAGCPFCAQGVKVDTRIFVKALAYVVDEQSGEVKLVNTVWDRAAAFADIDIKNLMQEYGDISNYLFKIKRNGVGPATRYTISIVMNNTVYNPAVYKADFSELDKVDPVKILSKSLAQYNEALTPGSTQPAAASVSTYTTKSETVAPTVNPAQPAFPGVTPAPKPTAQPPVEENPTPRRATTKYQF